MIRINLLFVLFFVCNVSNAAINPMNYPPPVRQKLIEIKESCPDIADPTNKRPVYLEDHVVQKAELNGDGIQDFIVHESNEAYGGRHCGPVFGNSNGSIYIAVSGKNGLFKEAYYGHKGRQGEIHIDYRSKPNKITMELDNVYYAEQCGKDSKPNSLSTICNRTLLWNPVTKRLDFGPITFTPQQRRINSSNNLEFQKSQQPAHTSDRNSVIAKARSALGWPVHTSARNNSFNPQSDADYRNTDIPYQYRELSEPTDNLLQKVNDWLTQYESVEKLSTLGKISSRTVKDASDEFLYHEEGKVEHHHLKYDDGMGVEYIEGKPVGAADFVSFWSIKNIVSSDLIQRLTGFKVGQKMIDIRNKLGSPHMLTRGEKLNERIYFYFSDIHMNEISLSSLGVENNAIAEFYRAKDERLALAQRSQLSNFSAVYDENYKNPLKYGDEKASQSIWRVSFSFDENNLLKHVSFYFDPP